MFPIVPPLKWITIQISYMLSFNCTMIFPVLLFQQVQVLEALYQFQKYRQEACNWRIYFYLHLRYSLASWLDFQLGYSALHFFRLKLLLDYLHYNEVSACQLAIVLNGQRSLLIQHCLKGKFLIVWVKDHCNIYNTFQSISLVPVR